MPRSDPDQAVDDLSVDLATLRDVLEQHPVRLAILFGSEVMGETHPGSDLDLAVEFDESVDDVSGRLLSLHSDLMTVLDRNDVDLSVVDDLEPRIGLAAFSEGVLLLGSEDRMVRHRRSFERAVEEEAERRGSLRERFDAVIDSVDDALGIHS